MKVFFPAMAFAPLGNSDHFVSIFLSISKQDAPFPGIAYDNSCDNWDGLHDHLRDVTQEVIFKFSAFLAGTEFCDWIKVKIDVYIKCHKYQVKPYSSPWISVACAATFCLIWNSFSASKVKFRQANNNLN